MQNEEIQILKQDAFREGMLHAFTSTQLHSVSDVSMPLREALEEEGFADYHDTLNLTRDWTDEQRDVLKSIWKKR